MPDVTIPAGEETPAPRRANARIVLDVTALLTVVLGVAGLAVAAFCWDWRAGLATVSLAAIATGVLLGLDT